MRQMIRLPSQRFGDAEGDEGSRHVRGAPGGGDDPGEGSQDLTVQDGSSPGNGQEAERKGQNEEEAASQALTGASGEEKAEEASQVLDEIQISSFLAWAALQPDTYIGTSDWVYDTARQNDKRPARITFAVPDDHVKNLAGFNDQRDFYFYVRVPKDALGRLLKQRKKPLVWTPD